MSVTRNEIHQFIRLNSLSIHKKEDSLLVYNFIKEHDLKFQGKRVNFIYLFLNMVKDGLEVNKPIQSLLGRIQLGLKMILIPH